MFLSKVKCYYDNIQCNERFSIMYRGNYNSEMYPHGFGICYKFGDVYVGGMKHGYRHGYGILKCREGYKRTSKPYTFKYMKRGIYIGFFNKNKFITGKFIEMDSTNKVMTKGYLKNKKQVGDVHYIENDSLVSILYKNSESSIYEMKGDSIQHGCIHNGVFSGQFYNMYMNSFFHRINYYESGILHGPILFLRYKSNMSHILYHVMTIWEDNVCKQIHYIKNDLGIIYNPISYLELKDEYIPKDYICPINYELMKQPVKTEYNTTYEYESILQWLSQSKDFRDPLTNMRYKDLSFFIDNERQVQIFDFIWTNCFPRNIIGTLT